LEAEKSELLSQLEETHSKVEAEFAAGDEREAKAEQ